MRNRIIFIVIILIILLVVGLKINRVDPIEAELTCNYFTEALFNNNIANAVTYETASQPIAGVFPHNEAIMDMTASVLKTASNYDYDTIVLLAPNHKASVGKILISGKNWDTPFGVLEGDSELEELIVSYFGPGIIREDTVVQEDHSASIVTPYIKKYMPDVKLVTLLVNKEMSINDVYNLADALELVSEKENILVLGSIDFAHYQDYETTVLQDKKTLSLIEEGNIEQLKVLHGENLDTAEAMGVIILYSKAKGIEKLRIEEERIVSNMPYSNDYGSYMSIIARN